MSHRLFPGAAPELTVKGLRFELEHVERMLDGPYATMGAWDAAGSFPRTTWEQWCDGLTYDQALKGMERDGRAHSGLVGVEVVVEEDGAS